MKTRRRKLRKGGDAISGQQGCVIIPSLLVDTQMRTRNASHVTKIFYDANDFVEEKENNDLILSTIDPGGSFTSAKYSEEPVDSRYLTPNELAACPKLKGQDTTKLKYLNYKFLGKSIDEIIQKDMRITPETSRAIIAALANLSVKVLYMNNDLGKFHNDMHEGNIMYNFTDEHAYLIDFAKLASVPNSNGPLTDLEGIVLAVRMFASLVLGQRRLPKPLLDQLTSFVADAAKVITNRPKVESPNEARRIVSKFLTDFSLAYSTAVGGRRRKTLRRRAH